ncbi:ABC transporter ATP-binding protein [Tepidibacter formicigenes]|uniref:ABC-2 type transport system ATP-binding protein n=1 Tax=Tepidibacter formicigenes DSM 15518 TaxID=1123349 RepID=A0A1M6KQC2_9FIRM|nr:ABC transporter ATP-binding protein [Tepidibacter formicigenes]SHJ61130.1 ABC-2 type transport system ATP-binding protein [Tepidibacter formicigenes DSM 15518]
MIYINNVYKSIGNKSVLKSINLKVQKGSIFGLIGENGAGKTTLIKCLTGIYKADKGEIKIDNEEVFENNKIKDRMGYVADQNNYFSFFKVKEIINFYKDTYSNFSIDRFRKLNNIFKIFENKRIKDLSKGMKMQLSLMLNLSINAKVLILDEPTSGLDVIVKKKFTNILLEEVEKNNTTIFISSHNLGDLERICDNIAIINRGEIKYVNSIENMKKNIKKLQVLFNGKVPEEIHSWKEIMYIKNIGRINYIITKNYSKKLEDNLINMGAQFVEEIDLGLEEMFIYSVGEELDSEKCMS